MPFYFTLTFDKPDKANKERGYSMTRSRRAARRMEHWTKVVSKREASGQSVRAYCRDAGITERVYFYWQRKVREAASGQTVGRKEGNRLINPAANGFAEVRLLEQPERAVPRDAKTPSVIRVEGHGLQIVADENYPVAKLSELLRCLVRL